MARPDPPAASRRSVPRLSFVLAAALVLAVGCEQVWLTRDLVQLPSPLFGGDYTYQMGCIQSIRDSGDPMASCSVCGALPGYLPLYGVLVAGFSRVTHQPVVQSMLACSALLRALSTLVIFLVLADLFGASAALVLTSLWVMLNPGLLVKYTEFTAGIVVPLYFHALDRFARRPTLARSLSLGLVLAAAGYAHAVVFFGGTLIAVAVSVLAAAWRGGRTAIGSELVAGARGLLIVLACEALALGYWYRPLFVFHGHASAHYVEWNGGVALSTLPQRLAYARSLLSAFTRLDDWPHAELNLLFFGGLVCAARIRDRGRFVPGLLIAGATLVWVFHFFVTLPLLGTHFVPSYVWRLLWAFAVLLVAAIPVVLAFESLRGRLSRAAIEVAAVGIALAVLIGEARALARQPDMVTARRPLPAQYLGIQTAVLRHTRPGDVFLSTNELSFALSALTGRKTLVTRRAQNDAFLDMDERNRDAALILYGRDDTLRRRLITRWGIGYLLWTDDWVSGEYGRGPNGTTGYVDPLMFFYNPAYESELHRAGVATATEFLWVDPFLRGAEYPRFDLTLVTPDNYEREDHPWRSALDSLLVPVWYAGSPDRKRAVIYRIRP